MTTLRLKSKCSAWNKRTLEILGKSLPLIKTATETILVGSTKLYTLVLLAKGVKDLIS
jgi:hypothetical protein